MGPGSRRKRAEGQVLMVHRGGKFRSGMADGTQPDTLSVARNAEEALGDGACGHVDGPHTTETASAEVVSEHGGRRRGVVIAVVVALLALGVMWAALRVMGGVGLGQDPFGRPAPDFVGPLLDGKGTLALADLRGKPVVLNFWASWCGPCKDEAPVLAAAEQRWRSQGIVFLGVDSQDTVEAGRAFEESFGIGYRSVVDQSGKVATEYGVLGFPETFFIDAQSTIVAKYVGPLDPDTLDAYLSALVG